MKGWIYFTLGRLLGKLATVRNKAWREVVRRKLGSIDPTAIIEYPLKLTHPECIHIGRRTEIAWCGWLFAVTEYFGQRFDPEIRIGDDCTIGNHVHIVATNKILLGKNVMLADRVYISDNAHDYRNVHSPIMRSDLICCGEVHIGDDSWIGENVCIFGDIRIGRHCVVGANAVVNRHLPDFSVAVGAPARIIKRYNPASKDWEATDPEGRFINRSPQRNSRQVPSGGAPR
ncbi:MAG: acyltransferase [Opitutales bacterium]